MEICLENIRKRFFKEWIFKNINFTFQSKSSYALLGNNGSGKSTLLQVLAGIASPSSGNITYHSHNGKIEPSEVYQYLSIVAPYQSLIEELTLKELFDFHFSFKKPISLTLDFKEWLSCIGLEGNENKFITHFSSGMKQRVKLGLAFYTKNQLLLLDEPTTNLDVAGIDWYMTEIEKIIAKTTLIIASNQREEYAMVSHILKLSDWK